MKTKRLRKYDPIYQKKWRDEHKDYIKKYNAEYIEKHPERKTYFKKYMKEYVKKHRNYFLERSKEYAKNNKEKRRLGTKLHNKKYPEKLKARNAVMVAVSTHKLHRPNICSICKVLGSIQAHHEDYYKPLDVMWLCRKCHHKLHSKKSDQLRPKIS